MSLLPQVFDTHHPDQPSRKRAIRLVAPAAIGAIAFLPLTSNKSQAQSSNIAVNGVYTIVSACNDTVVDIAYVSTADGAAAIPWSRNSQANQQWILTNKSPQRVSLVAAHSSKPLGTSGSEAIQVGAGSEAAHEWMMTPANGDSWTFSPASTPNLALARAAATGNDPLVIRPKASGCEQRWKLELLRASVAPTSPPTTTPATTTPATTTPATTTPATTQPVTVAPTTHNHTGGGGNAVLPTPAVGLSFPGTIPEATPIKRPSGDSTGNFRVVCVFSHMNYDDPIVHPNKKGAAHLHTYFGNVGARYDSTGASLLSSGNSTCDGGTLNRSSYWIPTIMAADGTPIAPESNMIYYKSGYQGVEPRQIVQTLPNGLQMIAGNPNATIASENSQVAWSCSTLSWRGRQGTIPSCPAGETLKAEIQFPQCWNGRDLSSTDLVSHLAYGQWGVGCPASHPIGLPSISFNITWPVPAGGTEGWHISSDKTPAADGASLHGDVILAWDPATSSTWLNNCVRQNADCNVGQITDTSRLISGRRQ
jgi:hypothetical protein